MTSTLLSIGQAVVGKAKQRSIWLLDQVDLSTRLDPGGTTSLPSQPKL
jgi:hypothetical protein